ncbi:MAG: ubiquinol-cytochrome c reductase iron-sulfur subunit [Proteobacteria bacterium]|nr:ubiquinol-cytochrome c reductase iron-sulfur subunit [Pseudomonadota bacterium]
MEDLCKKSKNPCENDCLKNKPRRDFLTLTAVSAGVVGTGAVLIQFLNSMNPSEDVKALSSLELNIGDLKEGESKTVMWRGKPVFVRHRTEDEIKNAKSIPLKDLKDPQSDQERFHDDPKYLIVIGICTHLGCIPSARQSLKEAPDGGGWFCACHGSLYDTSGRILKGPAPKNLEVPPYKIQNGVLKIGL